MSDRLFTPRFITMFCYSFTVFVSLFQLLPAAPYRILALGGSTAVAGLFQGALTFASAFSAAFTGPLCDRWGHRPVLIVVSIILTAVTASYAFIESYPLMFAVALGHGLVWSALLTASGAYMTATIPPGRRAEGLNYWGLASVTAVGAAPALGFWVYRHGWVVLCAEIAVLNLVMAIIAWKLPDDRLDAADARRELDRLTPPPGRPMAVHLIRTHVEWRVLLLSLGMGFVAFGWGALTSFSALFADTLGVTPRSAFLTAMAAATLIGRLTIGRGLDRLGHRRVLLRCFLAPPVGLALLAAAQGRPTLVAAGLVFGAGFGLLHPAFTAYVLGHVAPNRRGAAFGALLAAFDTGIGAGSSLMGGFVHAYGYRMAFAASATIAALALPWFLAAERRLGFREA
jgi:MFS family permease